MASIKAHIGAELYKTEITSPTGNVVIADEPVDKGGGNKGFSPEELLASALASCTCITVRMYADRKGWDLEHIDVDIAVNKETGQTKFTREIKLTGNLDEAQRIRILAIANACPIHKVLTNPIVIETVLV